MVSSLRGFHKTSLIRCGVGQDFNSYVTVSTADGAPQRKQGRMAASTAPGLGIAPKMDVLGRAVVEVS